MSIKEFRAAVSLGVKDVLDGFQVPLFFENGDEPDEDAVGLIWAYIEIRWYGAVSKAIGEGGSGRHSGAISVEVYCRDSEGTGRVDDVLDEVSKRLANKRVGKAVVKFPQRIIPSSTMGWYRAGLLYPFTLDE